MSVDFIDSNVFIYLFDGTAPKKRKLAEQLVHTSIASGKSIISHQVVQEVLNVITKRLDTPLSAADATSFLTSVLLPLWKVAPSPELYHRALTLQARYKQSFYDSLIISAAIEGGCSRLLSEDMQHGLKIDKLVIHNPFL